MTRPSASDPAVSARMKRQKRTGTRPELAVRRVVSRLGHRYRLNSPALPGSPDLSNRARGWCIFVHGCYWHHHPGCSRATVPRNNREWWLAKFDANRRRDVAKVQSLETVGLHVLVVWECETSDDEVLSHRLGSWLEGLRPSRK